MTEMKHMHALGCFHAWFGAKAFERHGVAGVTDRKDMAPACHGCGGTEGLSMSGGGYRTFCRVCNTVAGQYAGIKRPGRMGAGWAALITPEQAWLSSTSPDNAQAFAGAQEVAMAIDTPMALQLRALLSPPEPPFLLVVFSQSSVDVIEGLRVSWSTDILHIGSGNPVTVNARAVRNGLEAVRASGISVKHWENAARASAVVRRAMAAPGRIEKAHEELAGLEKKLAGITALAESLPLFGSPELDWIRRAAHANV